MKKSFSFFLLLLFCLSIGQTLHYLREGFSSRRFQPYYRFMGAASKIEFNQEVEEVLMQPFYYLGRGRQCFAFQSKDGKYVLKLPRTDILKTPFWLRSFPLHKSRQKIQKKYADKYARILESFQLAQTQLQNETDTVLVHPGGFFSKKTLTLIDKLGTSHHLPLESTVFALQYKHSSWTQAFLQSLNQKDEKQSKKILDALIEVIIQRAQKGIVNRDRSFLKNYGYDGQKAFQIDIGSFYQPTNIPFKNAFEKSICDSFDPIESWLAATDPQMLSYFLERKEQILSP